MMFGQGFFDFGLSEGVLHLVQIIAAVGGAVVGWFVSDPLTRILYRVSFKGATPPSILLGSKLTGAATLSLLMYFCISLGGGGGWGFGPGAGGSPGKGPGQGGDKSVAASDGKVKTEANDKSAAVDKTPGALKAVRIVIVSKKDFVEDGMDRFFLVDGAKVAISRAELEVYFQKNHAKIEVTPVLTPDSIGTGQEENPLSQLLELRKKHNVKTLRTEGP